MYFTILNFKASSCFSEVKQMQNSKNKFPLFQSTYMQAAGIMLLIFLAVLMLLSNDANSMQSISATSATVRFYGAYRIGDGP